MGTLYSGVEQLVAHQAHNLEVRGSSPLPATNIEIGGNMKKECAICKNTFDTKGTTRKYCYYCVPAGLSRSQAISQLRRAMKQQAIKLKGGKCSRCGYNKCLNALTFHHSDPTQKEFGLAQGGNTHSWESYWNEVQKCELLCANCHAEEHSN